MFDYEKILDIATARFRRWALVGVRGQLVDHRDSLDYWVAQVAYEFGLDNKETMTNG